MPSTRPGDEAGQAFARRWAPSGRPTRFQPPPVPWIAAIIFAADGALAPLALRAVRKGGAVVCAGIHMSQIPAFLMGPVG
jgi:propanol-preferring alcohol dehydrogenase